MVKALRWFVLTLHKLGIKERFGQEYERAPLLSDSLSYCKRHNKLFADHDIG